MCTILLHVRTLYMNIHYILCLPILSCTYIQATNCEGENRLEKSSHFSYLPSQRTYSPCVSGRVTASLSRMKTHVDDGSYLDCIPAAANGKDVNKDYSSLPLNFPKELITRASSPAPPQISIFWAHAHAMVQSEGSIPRIHPSWCLDYAHLSKSEGSIHAGHLLN